MIKVNYCGGAAQKRMIRNGWRLVIPEWILTPGDKYKHEESAEELYNRLSEKYWDVRVYWCGSMIPGIHNHFAMVKKRKENAT